MTSQEKLNAVMAVGEVELDGILWTVSTVEGNEVWLESPMGFRPFPIDTVYDAVCVGG